MLAWAERRREAADAVAAAVVRALRVAAVGPWGIPRTLLQRCLRYAMYTIHI